jgi:hypothetical protein
MMHDDKENVNKVVHIGRIRKEKEEKSSPTTLLRDTKKVALAIQHKTCLLCHTKKMCVNLTGLCASCYDALSPLEQKIADNEAQHKSIEIKVTDDRWPEGQD